MNKVHIFQTIITLINDLQEMILLFRMQNFNRAERMFSRWTGTYGQVLSDLFACKAELNAGSAAEESGDGNGSALIDETVIMAELQDLMHAMEQKDYVLMADLMQLQILPFLESVQNVLRELIIRQAVARAEVEDTGSVDTDPAGTGSENADVEAPSDDDLLRVAGAECEDDGKIYRLEPTSSGDLTLSITDADGTYYLHSNASPVQEGMLFAQQYYDCNAASYAVYGLGLGYHVLALCKETHGLVPVTVYESDANVIDLARKLTDFSLYEGRNLKIVHDPTLAGFAQAISGDVCADGSAGSDESAQDCSCAGGTDAVPMPVIHYPSIRNVKDPAVRERLLQLFVQDSSIRNQVGEMLANFRYNVGHASGLADVLEEKIRGRDVILVAAGPSLDANVELLRPFSGLAENRGTNNQTDEQVSGGQMIGQADEPAGCAQKKPVIICVGTAFRKLLGMGIRPDFVGFLDASERIRAQIRGVETETVPALIGSTATMMITKDYAGEKYLICQQGFAEAEHYAKEQGGRTYESGGSIATILFDMARQLGASRIMTVGLDLAYTGMKLHADGAGRSSVLQDAQGLVEVPSLTGGSVYTTSAMQMYIAWFEKYIKAHADAGTEFIDATEGGAKITGMRVMKLAEALAPYDL